MDWPRGSELVGDPTTSGADPVAAGTDSEPPVGGTDPVAAGTDSEPPIGTDPEARTGGRDADCACPEPVNGKPLPSVENIGRLPPDPDGIDAVRMGIGFPLESVAVPITTGGRPAEDSAGVDAEIGRIMPPGPVEDPMTTPEACDASVLRTDCGLTAGLMANALDNAAINVSECEP